MTEKSETEKIGEEKTTNNVYIAGSCKNRKAVKALMTEIEKWGYRVIFDWTVRDENNDVARYVKEDIRGIEKCDNFVYCMDGSKSRGKYFELGYATALGKRIGICLLPNRYNITNGVYNQDILPFSVIMENDSIFIKSKMYPILNNMDELKIWLLGFEKI